MSSLNPTKLTYQLESFKPLFASEYKLFSSILDMTKLLIIDHNNLMTSILNLLMAIYLFITLK